MKRSIRADALRISANPGRVQVVQRFVRDFRRAAISFGKEQWRLCSPPDAHASNTAPRPMN